MVALTDGSGNRNGGLVTKMIPANKIKAEMFLMQVNLCPRKMAAKIMVKSGLVNIKVIASPTCKTLISSRTLYICQVLTGMNFKHAKEVKVVIEPKIPTKMAIIL